MIAFRSMTLPLFALVAALAGCSAEAGTSAGAESVDDARSSIAAEQTEKADGPRARGHAHGGPDFLVHAALRAPINLTAEQKTTIEGLLKANAPERPRFDAARAKTLAAAIRSNSVDDSMQPRPDASHREARIAASAKVLATLHDTLTAEQRVALVDSINKRGSAHGEHGAKRGGERGKRGEHGERGPRRGGEGHLRGPGRPGGMPMHLLAGLDLTQEQKDAIKTKLEAQRPAKPTEEQREAMKAKFESMRSEMQAKLESFKGDTFDATAFVTPSKELAGPRDGAMNRVNHLAVITSVLTPAQREALAARIEQGPPAEHARTKAPQVNAPQLAK